MTTLPLVAQVVEAVDIPVVAAGGFATGRNILGALAMGCVGVQMVLLSLLQRNAVYRMHTSR